MIGSSHESTRSFNPWNRRIRGFSLHSRYSYSRSYGNPLDRSNSLMGLYRVDGTTMNDPRVVFMAALTIGLAVVIVLHFGVAPLLVLLMVLAGSV